jgi:thioredoxin-related protein
MVVARRCLLTLACLMALLLAGGARAQDAPALEWGDDIFIGRDDAMVSGKPLLIYFYNRVARPCREMEETTFRSPKLVEQMNEGFELVRVDGSARTDLFAEYRLFKVPSIVFVSSEGRELDRAVGYKTPFELEQYIEKALSDDAGEEGLAVDISKPGPDTQPVVLTAKSASATHISVVGDFNDWRPGINELVRKEGTDLWEVTVHLRPGIHSYKLLDNDGNFLDDAVIETRALNGLGTFDSVVLVGPNPAMSPLVGEGKVTFFLYRPDAKEVAVAGEFSNWEPFTMFRNPDDEAMWGVRWDLEPGTYQYRFVIDGTWMPDPENYTPVFDPQGLPNSTFTIR